MIFTQEHWGRGKGVIATTRRTTAGVLSAYSGILFVDQPLIGLLFLGATFWFPNVGIAGVVAAAIGMIVAYTLRLPYATSGVNVYSSLLVGLSLGAYYELNGNLLLLIALTAALTVLLGAALRDVLWRLGHLPVLSVPFVLVALTAALAANTYGGLTPYYPPSQLPPALIAGWLDSFFSALGSTFFSPHPLVGAILFVGILLRSRYLAFLCAAGFASGQLVFIMLASDPATGLLEWTGFNFALTAMALGGIFAVPSPSTFVLGIFGAGVAAVLTGALSQLLLVHSLPVMALPFLLSTLTLLAALRLRVSASPPTLLLESPDFPERNYERARLARARLGSPASVPVLAPFLGEWQIYQGFDGGHTHKDQWRFALDFHRLERGRSFSNDGSSLEDYRCFGLPVLSPVYGQVIEVRDALPDNVPGQLDLANNWGNYALIRTETGLFVLLAHLKQHSLKVREGEVVTPNTPIASCGNSGRSPQPHLHLQIQRHGSLGGATVPFHLVSSIVSSDSEPPTYRLVADLDEGDSVQRAQEDPKLAGALQLPVGRTLTYRVTNNDGEVRDQTLRVEVTLIGQYRLTTDRGASAAFEQRNGTLGFYDRQGPADPLLDLWLLALGLTPLTELASAWRDEPPARLMPLGLWARCCLATRHPLGAGIASRYQRAWLADDETWLQQGEHSLEIFGRTYKVGTRAAISPVLGCTQLSIADGGRSLRGELISTGQLADRGVPAWEQDVGTRAESIEV